MMNQPSSQQGNEKTHQQQKLHKQIPAKLTQMLYQQLESLFGASALNMRRTKSCGLSALSSAIVVTL